jgi:hypothetical protein
MRMGDIITAVIGIMIGFMLENNSGENKATNWNLKDIR